MVAAPIPRCRLSIFQVLKSKDCHMPRLPGVGSDSGSWGTVLNQFLLVAHREDGQIKNTVSALNIRDFGAKGDNAADDTAAIQAAAGLGGGIVFIPPGRYITRSTLTFTKGETALLGVGRASMIVPIGNFDTVAIASPEGKELYGNRIADIYFDETRKMGGLTFIGKRIAQLILNRVVGSNGWNGWHFHNFNNVTLELCRFDSYRGEYYGKATGGGPGPGKRSDVLRLFGLVMGGQRKPGIVGLDIDGFVHTVNGWGVHLINVGGQGLIAQNTLGAENDPNFFTFDDFECDYPDRECIRLDAGHRFFFANAQINGARGPASNVFIGPKVSSVAFTGGFSSGAQHSGIAIEGSDVNLSAMHFHFNSSPEFGGSKNAHAGILLGPNSRDVTVTGCRSGQKATRDWQSVGCQIEKTADGFVILGNDFRYNVTPGVKNRAGRGPSKIIANNI
jgi:hypothetical protein